MHPSRTLNRFTQIQRHARQTGLIDMSNIITIILNSEIAKPDAPIFANGNFIDGKMGEHVYCRSKCSTKECMKERTEREHTCANGLSFYPYKVGDTWITIH